MDGFYGKVYRYADGVIGVKRVTENPMSFGIVYKRYKKPRVTGELMRSNWTAEEAQAKLDTFALVHELPEVLSMSNQEKTKRVRPDYETKEWKEDKYGVILDSEGKPVASTHRYLETSSLEYLRNVRLIAAAPDMLRILRTMCIQFRSPEKTKDYEREIEEAEQISAWIATVEE